MTADPRKVANAAVIRHLTYDEVFELSTFGAKVVYPPTVCPLLSANIPMLVKNTFNPAAEGTLIDAEREQPAPSGSGVKGVSSIDEVVLLTLQGVGMTGVQKRLFTALAQARAGVILISQASSGQSVTVALAPKDLTQAQNCIADEFAVEMRRGALSISADLHMSIIALVGENICRRSGVSGQLFGTLGKNGIRVSAIAQSASAMNISAAVAGADLNRAVNLIHAAFFEN
jgi:aspartokinase/homoserine dehydrogenase 1